MRLAPSKQPNLSTTAVLNLNRNYDYKMTSNLNLLKMNIFILDKQRLTGEKADENLVETVRAMSFGLGFFE